MSLPTPSFGFSTSFSDINTGLFGTDQTTSGSQTTDITRTESLDIDEAALFRLVDEALSGVSGLEAIFGQEAGSGLFNSSGAKAGTGDLIAKIAGELAKVTAVKTATEKGTTTSEQSTESDGLLSNLTFGLL